MTEYTTNGEMMLNLCKTVVLAAERGGGELQTAAETLLIAYIYNNADVETMKAAHRIAVQAGYDFSMGAEA